MCYSAQIWADYRKFTKVFGAIMDVKEFVRMFWERVDGAKIKIPKAMEAAFADPQTEQERQIQSLIAAYGVDQAGKTEQELFKQTKRLADAERTLQLKTTKAAVESKRIAADKIEKAKGKLADLRRTQLEPRDSRIFPGNYAPVMVMEDGKRVIKPMRYQCRPAGKPAFYDTRFPGTYNARRDSLDRFWKGQFGVTHGILVANSFFENVSLHRNEGRELAPEEIEKNVILQFRPEQEQDMLFACLWSVWKGPGQPDLISFAIITDDPPPEIAIAGHDRCPIPLKPQNVDAWLNPDPNDLVAQYAILDDRERPHYAYRMAA